MDFLPFYSAYLTPLMEQLLVLSCKVKAFWLIAVYVGGRGRSSIKMTLLGVTGKFFEGPQLMPRFSLLPFPPWLGMHHCTLAKEDKSRVRGY